MQIPGQQLKSNVTYENLAVNVKNDFFEVQLIYPHIPGKVKWIVFVLKIYFTGCMSL